MGFEVVRRMVTVGGLAALSVVLGHVVADFELGLGQAEVAAAVEQFGFEPAPERFGVGVVIEVAAPTHTLQRTMFGG